MTWALRRVPAAAAVRTERRGAVGEGGVSYMFARAKVGRGKGLDLHTRLQI